METKEVTLLGGGALAYLGDAVFELLVRCKAVQSGITDPGKLNEMALRYVRATAQSVGVGCLLPQLTEQESADYRRGRNGAGAHPKSATVAEYRRATGLEALFGALYLRGEQQRAQELFALYANAVDAWEQQKAEEGL